MPISATGRATRPAAGLTLIELVVVVAILAVLALPLTLRAGGLLGGTPPLRATAARLVADLEAARDRALMAGRSEALIPAPDGWTTEAGAVKIAGLSARWEAPEDGIRFWPDLGGTPFSVRLTAGSEVQVCRFDGRGAPACTDR